MKPDMTDQDLDNLLAELAEPELPKGLTANIMARLPTRKTGWRETLLALLGLNGWGLPAAGAFASVIMGVMAGYMLAPTALVDWEDSETEMALTLAFGDESLTDLGADLGPDLWDDLAREVSR